MRGGCEKGSFTIEAAIIVPFFLFLMIAVLQIGIEFYQESTLRTPLVKWEQFQATSLFYRMQLLEEWREEQMEDE